MSEIARTENRSATGKPARRHYCFNCGKDLGPWDRFCSTMDDCGAIECAREARNAAETGAVDARSSSANRTWLGSLAGLFPFRSKASIPGYIMPVIGLIRPTAQNPTDFQRDHVEGFLVTESEFCPARTLPKGQFQCLRH